MIRQSIGALNYLAASERRAIYARFVPPDLIDALRLPVDLRTPQGEDLLEVRGEPGAPDVQVILRHEPDARDPVLYAHLTDTLHGQTHVLLYIINDPASPRFDVDVMPDGRPTHFGTELRNLLAEEAAMRSGLAPGQIRRGLRVLPAAIGAFEDFVASLDQELFFVEPLYYHNAVNFEKFGFAYQQGLQLMRRIDGAFAAGGHLTQRLDGSTPFRMAGSERSIRLRSWALHDGILGEPFTGVRMYRRLGAPVSVNSVQGVAW
jgi:acetoin utilization protein AcuC